MELKALQHDVNEFKLETSKIYLLKNDFEKFETRLFNKLDNMDSKLDKKADR